MMSARIFSPKIVWLFLLGAVVFLSSSGTLLAGSGVFKLPAYEKYTLKNGLTVYLMEQHEVPLVYVSMVTPGGATRDGERYGLASLTAEGLLFGTKHYTKTQIEEELDFLGAELSTGAGTESAHISVSFAAKDQDKVFPILKEVITAPTFDEQEFEKRKTRLLVELAQAKESPRQVANSYFDKFMFGAHPYGNPSEGIPQTVEPIEASDLQDFYKATYHPEQSAIAVVGDFDSKKMKKALKSLVGGWKSQGPALETLDLKAGLPTFDKPRVLLVDKEDSIETTFLIGATGIARDNPDYIPIQVVNTILGGRFTSWLNSELRIKGGLTYGVRSGFSAYKVAGTFSIYSFTRTETTIEAIDKAVEVLGWLREKGIDQETLTSAKNYIKGQYPPRYETSGQLAGLLTSMFVYDYDESFINGFQAAVDGMTVEKTAQIIERYYPKDNLQFVLIGKSSEIRDKVGKYGEVTEKEITADGY